MPKILSRAISFLEGIADRIISVLGAIALAQFPQFFSYYLQRLGGHVSEARQIVFQYRRAADSLGISLEEYIETHLDAENEVFISSGEVMSNFLIRLEELEASFYALQQSNPLNRWWVFFQEADWEIARNTLHIYSPGVPTTFEGLIYAILGLLAGWGLFCLLKILGFSLKNALKENFLRAHYEEEDEELPL